MGTLKARVGGAWVNVSTGGDPVWVDPNAPTDPTYELWYDTDAFGYTPGGVSFAAGRNLIDNGRFAVKQRSITSIALPASGTVLSDRWFCFDNGVGAATLGVLALPTFLTNTGATWPAGRPRPANIQYTQMTTAEAAGSLSAGDLMLWQHAIEGQFLQHLNWGSADAQPLTLSFDIYSTIATTYVAELFRPEATGRTISRLVSVPAGWSTQVVSFPGDTTTVITNDNVSRLYVSIWQGAGSTYTSGTLQTAWGNQVNANRCPGISNAFAATVSNTFAATNIQLEIGTVPSPYEVRRYDDELRSCMRYFIRMDSSNGVYNPFGSGQCASATGASAYIVLPAVMRATPASVSFTAAATFMVHTASTGAAPCTAISYGGTAVATNRMIRADATVASGLVAGNATTLWSNNTTTAAIEVSAEI